jgi:H+-transporting ATPase
MKAEEVGHAPVSAVTNGQRVLDARQLASVSLDEVKQRVGFQAQGLTDSDAAERLTRYGPNELPEEKVNPVLKFLSYFWGPIPWMIEVAVVFSALVHHWEDLIIILLLLLANGIIGFWEEFQAGNTIAALKARLALNARVKRGGGWKGILARDLVPGDIIRLRIGDIIPADARLLEGDPIEVDQSALTGESLPVSHTAGDAVYSGSIVKQGEIEALVYGTGVNTYFGRTAELVEQAHTRSHFQRAVLHIGNYLIVIAIVLVVLIVAVALFRGDPIVETLLFALVLTIAAIPVAMPTVLSVTMAFGARFLAAKQAIVSKLASIEELAGVDVLCSDKTGTLTQNKLTVGESFAVAPGSEQEVERAAALASRAENQDSIDLAVLSGLKDPRGLEGFRVTHFVPFDPVHKRTEATVQGPQGSFVTTKGAVQVILDLASPDATVAEKVQKAVDGFAARGFRSLGVARRDGDGPWRFLGVIPLFDPVRDDSRSTIEAAGKMGISVKMVTGDQVAIAKETARQLGLGPKILDATRFATSTRQDEEALAEEIERADGFAQVFPEHKFHIVDDLQKRGHIVGMTGDGVNDAPALKKADVGIAVSGATDAARSAAAIVLLSAGLSVIVDAIGESRKIFQRMTNYAMYRIAETIRVLLFMTLSILVFNFYPVTAVMIVLLALLNDGAIISIAFDRARVSERPVAWDMRTVLGMATVLGVAGVIASFGLFYLGERVFHFDRTFIQTLMYLKLSVAGTLTIYVTRTRGHFWSYRPSLALFGAVSGAQLIATFITVYGAFMQPIGWMWALGVWAYALVWIVINDFIKLAAYRLFGNREETVLDSMRKSTVLSRKPAG